MNAITHLDIRIAVLAHSFVSKEGSIIPSFAKKPMTTFRGDERIVSLYRNSPKPHIERFKPKLPNLIRKGEYALIRIVELLKVLMETNKPQALPPGVAPPRCLLVPQLPHPPFRASKPPRFFWHPAHIPSKDEYAPSCLISETKEGLAPTVFNSLYICTYARCAFPLKGTLKQDPGGFVYLELSGAFITELAPLITDKKSQAIPFSQQEPSAAHIPVILPHETDAKRGLIQTQDLEKPFFFKINKLSSLRPLQWPGIEKVYFLSVSSPQLEKFRERCLLPALIRGHEFHIAIAYNKKAMCSENSAKKETFRLNVSCFAA